MGNIQNQISDPFEISGHIVVRDDHPQIRGPRTVKHDHIDHFVADFDLYTVDDPFVARKDRTAVERRQGGQAEPFLRGGGVQVHLQQRADSDGRHQSGVDELPERAGTHTQARGAIQGAERNLRARHPDFAGNGRWGMEKGGRVESLESGGRGVGTQDTAYAYASQARSRTRAGTKGRRDYTEHAGYDKR